ncbi:type II toxin-antitoxin system HicA family toxin [Hyphomicrobium sp. ghe19]|uniref:type II toxin-antitoxin system HicA family toxin n=1 Tax=Hyphomicrobium sp. ghe19 TaxID=2682968 RepID=UPI0030CF1C10
MERNSRKILARLKQDGWLLVSIEGSHHKLRHADTGKTVIVPHPRRDLPTGTARAIAKHVGWL